MKNTFDITQRYTSQSTEDTEIYAKEFVTYVLNRPQASAATVVGLEGDLGAGKTTFTQCVAKILGVKETVTSPTFVIEKIYPLSHGRFSNFIHIDAYRLEKGEELERLGWKEILQDPTNLVFIEWPQHVHNILPHDTLHLTFEWIDKDIREINLK